MLRSLVFSLLALASGLLLVFGFAPLNQSWIVFISLPLLLFSWHGATPRQALWRGWLFGVGFYAWSVSWVYISMHEFAGMSMSLAGSLTLLFIAMLAFFPATVGYIVVRFFKAKRRLQYTLAFPALWVLIAWIQSWLFSGFPWLNLGYSQLNTPLRHVATYTSVYGIDLVIALISGLLVYGLCQNKKTLFKCTMVIGSIWGLAYLGGIFSWTAAAGNPVSVTLIQGNINQHDKWTIAQLSRILATYQELTAQHWQSQLIIWPEAAVPTLPNQVKNYLDTLAVTALANHSSIILGIPTTPLYQPHYFNSMMVLGDGYGRYNKRRLVPFGEFIPAASTLNDWLARFNIPILAEYAETLRQFGVAEFIPGEIKQLPLKAGGITLAPFICYESIFAEQVRRFLAKADAIVVISDDSWFGQSWASDQHLQMTRMRALETGRFVLFANNTASSAIIDPYGNVIQQAPSFTQATITASIIPMQGYTPWMLWGLSPLLLLAIVMLFIAGYSRTMEDL